MQIETNTVKKRLLLAWVFLTLTMYGVLYGYTSAQTYVINILQKYPPLKECEPLEEVHHDNEDYELAARNDKLNTLAKEGIGYYQCYCE